MLILLFFACILRITPSERTVNKTRVREKVHFWKGEKEHPTNTHLGLLMLNWAQIEPTRWFFLDLCTVHIVFELLCENVHIKLDSAVTVNIYIVIAISIHYKDMMTIIIRVMTKSYSYIEWARINFLQLCFQTFMFCFANSILFTHEDQKLCAL